MQTLRSIESAFLVRGAKAVISTLWENADLQGVVFSAVLHAHLGQPKTRGGLRCCRLALLAMWFPLTHHVECVAILESASKQP
ncbi:hypothetical protein ABB07_08695 [Streptomyces incarnatus]|uniref:CHAT domain-containing protein n=1 Tax=Streptomyces incarnatus TaxID=665007 RepID=A0ABM5TGI3_9ACTN|nr:hypothetical protein ABB07_08695 [Streptomyces incarnatus]